MLAWGSETNLCRTVWAKVLGSLGSLRSLNSLGTLKTLKTLFSLLTIFSKNPIYPKFYTIFVVNDKDAFLLSVEHTLKFLFNMNDSIEQLKIWIFRHKYLFVTIAFLIIIVFLDENNMMKHMILVWYIFMIWTFYQWVLLLVVKLI